VANWLKGSVCHLTSMGRYGRFEKFLIGPSFWNQIGTANSNRISKLRRSLVVCERHHLFVVFALVVLRCF